MTTSLRRSRDMSRRNGVRRAVVMMPNGLTLANLLCGVYAIILSFRGEFASAPGFIVLGGIADMLDGRVARATGTGSRFGEELDSLVDAISFGFAPALMVYLGLPNRGNWEWLFIFFFTSCAVMRLARFNVEQAGRKKTQFHGLPSPAAGLTLATYYWFAQTPLYNQTIILFTDSKTLSTFPWHIILLGLMATLAALMISDVPYPAVPSIGFRNIRQIFATLIVAVSVVLLVARREEFLFPALLAYVLYGIVKWLLIGFLGQSSTPDEIFWEREAELHQTLGERTAFGPESVHPDLDLEDDEEAAPPRRSRDQGHRSTREHRASRETRDGRDGRETREGRDREGRESREPREPRESRRSPERDAQREAQREARRSAQRDAKRQAQRDAQKEAVKDSPKDVSRDQIPVTLHESPSEEAFPRDPDAPDDTVALTNEDPTSAPARRRRRRRGGRGNRARGEGQTSAQDVNAQDVTAPDAASPSSEPHGITPPGPSLPDSPTGPAE